MAQHTSSHHTALNGTNGNHSDRYVFKTVKVRPETFKQLVRWKAEKETEHGRLLSFEQFFLIVLGEHFSASDINQNGKQ